MVNGLADLFRSSGADVEFVSGELVQWNGVTGHNEVAMSGARFYDVPVLVTTAMPTLAGGDAVGLLRIRNQWLLLGKIVQPPI